MSVRLQTDSLYLYIILNKYIPSYKLADFKWEWDYDIYIQVVGLMLDARRIPNWNMMMFDMMELAAEIEG